jgi:hypothetical protein
MRPLLLSVLVGASLGLCIACRCDSRVSKRTKPSEQTVGQLSKHELGKGPQNDLTGGASPSGDTLLERGESAYGTSLFVLSNEVLLLTQKAAFRMVVGEPVKTRALPLGPGPALAGDSIVYFHDGAVRAVPREGGESRVYGELKRPPIRFFASNERWGWLERGSDGSFALAAFQRNAVRQLYRTVYAIVFAAAWDEFVFFIEAIARDSWRIGRVLLDGGPAVFSSTRQGRTPSMLAPGVEGIFFYDGPTRTVRRLSPDLQSDHVLADKVICSPIAASDRVLCAQLGGVYEIPAEGGPPRRLAVEVAGPITAIAAGERRVVWVVDMAADRLAVRSHALAAR